MTRMAANGVHYEVRVTGEGPAVLFLHGFTGAAAEWAPFLPELGRVASCALVDLLGHGRSDAAVVPARHALERQAADLAQLLDDLGLAPATVVGYSLGSRVALRLALDRPESVRSLVLLSPSPGIADTDARAARRKHDESLARQLETQGLAAFVDVWEAQPLFAGEAELSAATRAHIREGRLRNDAAGLAASLRGAGQGSMTPLHDDLSHIGVPSLLVVGERDAVGVEHARTIVAAMPAARLVVLDGVGHAVQREAPAKVGQLLLEHLGSIRSLAPAGALTRSRS